MRHHLCHIFPNFGTGGPEVRTVHIMNALAARFRHTIVSLNGNFEGISRLNSDVVVVRRELPRFRGGWDKQLRLTQFIKGLGADLLLTYGWGGTDVLAAAMLARTSPTIHTEDGFLPDEARRQKFGRLMSRRLLLRAADHVVLPSRTLAAIAKRQWWLPDRKVSWIPNGTDTRHFRPAEECDDDGFRSELGFSDDRVVFGTVGALRPEKNHSRLLRALAPLLRRREARLLVVGDGPERAPLRQRITNWALSDGVTFVGDVPDPAPYYRVMDVFALSSDTEQMPLSVLEAMATGLPVVSTDVGDIGMMVGPGNQRFVIPVNGLDRLTRSMSVLAGDATLRRLLGAENCRRCVAEYSQQAMLNRYRAIYEKCIGDGDSGRIDLRETGS